MRTGFIAEEHVSKSPERAGRNFKAIVFLASGHAAALDAYAVQAPGGLVRSRLGQPTGSTNLAGQCPAPNKLVSGMQVSVCQRYSSVGQEPLPSETKGRSEFRQ